MSIRPRLGVEVPELTARVARASNPISSPRVARARDQPGDETPSDLPATTTQPLLLSQLRIASSVFVPE